mgnify:CR=1 FL=1
MITLSETDFKLLFKELINAGRDMESRDRLDLYYLSEEEYFKNILRRYKDVD